VLVNLVKSTDIGTNPIGINRMSKTWKTNILEFNTSLTLNEKKLPNGVHVLNPFKGEFNERIKTIASEFYTKYYNDNNERKLILGINPGRLGAGSTGIPFSDTKRLSEFCDIHIKEFSSHEPSSEFVYLLIEAFGGAEKFYSDFFISSVCPLGFTVDSQPGKTVNYNYYDSKALEKAVTPFIIESIERQLDFGVNRKKVFCLGTGKNAKFLKELNNQKKWFGEVVPLEHPRYVMQYKRKQLELYLEKFISLLCL